MEEASHLQGSSSSSQPSIAPASYQDEQSSSYTAAEIANRFIEVVDPKSHVDTAAPIDSVKGAVTKFGGILDWKEKRKQAEEELDKVQEDLTEYRNRLTAAEAGRAQALQDLGSATRAADKLRLSLKKAQIEDAQARQESVLAERRLRELQRSASERAVAEAELAAARDRREAARADLEAARAEVDSLEKVRAAAAAEAEAATARAREAAAESRVSAKAVEDLAAELIQLKAALASSHAAHVDAEEKRLRLALALGQDKSRWQIELEDAQQEAKRLRAQLVAACDVEMKAEAASKLLADLRAEAELLACAVQGTLREDEKPTVSSHSQPMLEKVSKELEDVKASVERAKDEAKCLRVAAASMRDDLDRRKAELAALQRREGLSSASVPYLKEELSRVTSELIAVAEAAAKAANDESRMTEEVGEARREAEEANAKARSAREEVAKASEEAGVAKAAVATMEARLEAVAREILAATTSEEIATASARALLQAESKAVVQGGVTLTVEEYGELSRRARETEEIAGRRVMEAVKLIKEAKDAEVRSLEKLAKQDRQTEQRRQALEAATLEAEEEEFQKLSVERELRQWRAEHDPQSPRTGLAEISVLDDPDDGDGRGNPHIVSPRGRYVPRTEFMGSTAEAEAEARQRKMTFFPRMIMFLARKRAQSWK